MSIFKIVEEVLVRDYEVVRRLNSKTIHKINNIIMHQLQDYEDEECTEGFIYEMAGEVIATLISKSIALGEGNEL